MKKKASVKKKTSKKKVTKKRVSKKVTERKKVNKDKFLQTLKEMPIIQVAAARVGINRSTYYRWREQDSDFRRSTDICLKKGREFVNDMMESLLINKAKEGNITSIIFWLKHNQENYMQSWRYNHYHEHTISTDKVPPERVKQIAEAIKQWSDTDYGDERAEDYEVQ